MLPRFTSTSLLSHRRLKSLNPAMRRRCPGGDTHLSTRYWHGILNGVYSESVDENPESAPASAPAPAYVLRISFSTVIPDIWMAPSGIRNQSQNLQSRSLPVETNAPLAPDLAIKRYPLSPTRPPCRCSVYLTIPLLLNRLCQIRSSK
jgi:hypothetical protein